MKHRFVQLLTVACLLLIAPSSASAQQGSADEVTLRMTIFGPVNVQDRFRLTSKDRLSDPFQIPNNGFSRPVVLNGMGRNFRLVAADDDSLTSLGAIALPEEGRKFILLLLPRRNSGYRPIVVRADDEEFRPGNIMIFNFTDEVIGAEIGEQRHLFEPASRKILLPNEKKQADRANYQVRFYQSDQGKPQVFAANLWPYTNNKRVYVFFVKDPESNTITYRAIDEFVSWIQPKKANP